MEFNTLKQKLEKLTCHIHGDAAYISHAENQTLKIETCCLLFRHQLLLMAGEDSNLVYEKEILL